MTIDKEFETLIPPLSPDEYRLLEESILSEGCRDALITWNGILIDGHNRYRICEKHGLPYCTAEIELEDRNAVKVWMMKNQLARRNLTDFQRCEMVYAVSDAVKEEAKKRQGTRTDLITSAENYAEVKKPNRATDILGSMAGVSGSTYERAAKVIEQGTPETKEALRRGDISINKAYEELQKPHVAYNSGNNEWYTPKEFIEAATAVMGQIDLDPASSEIANKTVGAKQIYTIEDNGLEKPWFGNVWLNPPYASDLIGKFAEKLVFELPNISQAIVLVNNATETEWFYTMVVQATAVCFPRSRVRFVTPDGTTGAPLQGQAILYFGPDVNRFINVFDEKGWCARL